MTFKLETEFREFLKQDDAAVTVDWVVLTASIVGLGVSVIALIASGAMSYAEYVNSDIEAIAYEVGFSGKLPD